MHFALTKRSFCRNILFIFTAVLFFSCQKDLSIDNGNGIPGPDLSTKINSSVSGFVTDENDAAVMGAIVQFGTSTISTNKYGYFEVKNVQVVKTAAVVTVSRPGYFKGIKTYMAEQGKAAFFRIKLIPKTIAGTVNGNTGGVVTLSNGLSITFPVSGFINASSNAAYTGTVNVAAHWLNPTATDLPNTMPGDLRGINTAGNLQLLTTYGMAAVELTGSGGELLQIATGKKATLSLPIPASMLSSAPASIPLWYFDEAKGLWKEEGSATKTGNKYTGEVSHFSFWNYDVPGDYVQFNCTVVNMNGQPIPYALVKISYANNPLNGRYGYADATGYVAGFIPDNSQLLLEIFSGSTYCSTPSYSQTFTTSGTDISLGNIPVSTATAQATITGSVTDCNNAPVTNGHIMMQGGNQYFWIPLTSTGSYSLNMLLCNSAALTVTLVAEDVTNTQQSSPITYTIVAGNNAIPSIQACGMSTQQFINYTINGNSYTYTYPADSINVSPHPVTPLMWIFGKKMAPNNDYVNMTINYGGIANGTVQALTDFKPSQIPQNSTIANPIGINITEYGSFGQFMSGNFSGMMTGPAPTNTPYTVSCSFRVRRL